MLLSAIARMSPLSSFPPPVHEANKPKCIEGGISASNNAWAVATYATAPPAIYRAISAFYQGADGAELKKKNMIKNFLLLLTALSLTTLTACAKDNEEQSQKVEKTSETAAPSQDTGHAAADVLPGSHEDWCGEHALPESQCTQCNPSLNAAFKATGDWCEEHGLPESQCLKCNPEIEIVRPPLQENKE